ncbi:MAG TPA: penicillin-binding protein activator [Casimicrobiaceae bacterium]|nr:penicillin-binding protein activator [Casimicrobiaceae bacterium]
MSSAEVPRGRAFRRPVGAMLGSVLGHALAPLLAPLLAALLSCAAALSAAQSPAASDADHATTQPSPVPPLRPPPSVDIALVLPLDVPAYARAADAISAGFTAAAARERTTYVVIPHGEDGILRAFEEARKAGAKVVVGPLLRDDLRVIAQSSIELPWTLALNQSDETAAGPPRLYTFALTVESDARTIARRMRDDAAQNVAIVAGESPQMKRIAGAFATAWLLEGGSAPASYRFDPAPEALTVLKRDLARKVPDAALLAVDGSNAALAKPFLGTVSAFASGLMFDQKDFATSRDLDGLTIVEIPWLVAPGAAEYAGFPRRDYGSAALERLYALGLDAFRIAQAMVDGPPEKFVLEGATGHVMLAEGRQFVREGRLAVYRAGQLVPLEGAR